MKTGAVAFALVLVLAPVAARAGGPAFIAGSGYDPGVQGQPLLWANETVQYYTDQGDLSPILNNAQADAFVAAAITPWTTAPGVGFTVTPAGHLAEDVNGSNILVAGGVITAPADITPSATGTPLGVVYDYDGSVTDALLGQGAGDAEDCFTNAVYGGPDNFSAAGNIVHALAVINGVCATASDQLPDVQYRLVRVLARTFGLGWSQANINVLTNNPPPTSDDLQGFPVMHYSDPVSCVPIGRCYPNAAVPKLDDVTAFAALYPASGASPQPTGGLWGGLYFTDANGNATQMMQGVNVVARMMVDDQPSRQYVVTSVSGFAFVGNAGNIITGYLDGNGLPYDRWGSSDNTLEGVYNLGQLMIPHGQAYVEYQLSVEPLDPDWSIGVGPYAPDPVAPSGSFAPVVITVVSGASPERDILMLGSEIAELAPGSGSTYQSPVPVPPSGGWGSWISGYGAADFFQFQAQANRTASVAVTALDESGHATESKLMPLVGIWEASDQSGGPAPASTPSAFNSSTFGMSRLDAQFFVSEAFRIGIADQRGDGRPDYFYEANLLYSDTVTPARLSLAGGTVTLTGIGFRPGLEVTANSVAGSVVTQSSTHLQALLPGASQDGAATIQVTDSVSGSTSQMIGALTYGAAATDLLALVQGNEPATPVGAQAPNLIRVRATASDGVTPVNGATIAWSSTNGIQFSVCNGTTACSVLTDAAGEASTWVTPTAVGPGTITAQLAPASYPSPQTRQTTLVGTSSALDLAALAPTRWIAQGATLSVPLTVEALDLGVPQANVAISFKVAEGAASLSSSTATTNSSGMAGVTAQLNSINATVQVNACVAQGNNPCQTFTLFAIPASSWRLEAVSGTSQAVPNGTPFQPLVMRVTDGSSAANPITGANVTFLTTLERNPQGPIGPPPSDNFPAQDSMPVILGTSPPAQVTTGPDGTASITPSVGSQGPCDAFVTVTAGAATAQFELESVDPLSGGQPPPNPGGGLRPLPPITHFVGRLPIVRDPQSFPFSVPQAIPADFSPQVCSHPTEEAGCEAGDERQPPGKGFVSGHDSGDAVSGDAESRPPSRAPSGAEPQPDAAETSPANQSAKADLRDRRSCRFAEVE